MIANTQRRTLRGIVVLAQGDDVRPLVARAVLLDMGPDQLIAGTPSSEQYCGTGCPLNFFQWLSQSPHLHTLPDVPFTIVTCMVHLSAAVLL